MNILIIKKKTLKMNSLKKNNYVPTSSFSPLHVFSFHTSLSPFFIQINITAKLALSLYRDFHDNLKFTRVFLSTKSSPRI